MYSSTLKRRQQHSIQKIRLALITMVAMQIPNILCLLSAQMVSVLSEEIYEHQNFKDIDFTNITQLDIMARKAMNRLHNDLDHNDDGNVSPSEGEKFMHREDFINSGGSNLPGFATDKDGRITELEFWETWVKSGVHNWTVAEMAEWLSTDVDLPQHASKFKQYGISGAAMPIFTEPGYALLRRLGIQQNSHKHKIQLRSTEIVLFGLPKSKSGWLKDVLLTVSIGLALGGIAFGVHVRRSATVAMATMQDKLTNLQREMKKLDEDDAWAKDLTPDDETGLASTECNSSTTSLASDSNLQSRVTELMEELSDTRMLLEEAEGRLNDRRWAPPSRLLTCLKRTYEVEMKLHEAKRQQAQKKVEQAKTQFLKMKKKTSIFTSVQLIHSRQVDSFDLDVQAAKDFLREVQRDSHEYRKRWMELESICNRKFVSSQQKVVTSSGHQVTLSRKGQRLNDVVVNKKVELDKNYNVSTLHEDLSSESSDGLSMTDVQLDKPGSHEGGEELRSLRSCPSFAPVPEVQSPGSGSSSTKPVSTATEDKFRTFPRKSPSPRLARSKGSAQSCVAHLEVGPRGAAPDAGLSPGRKSVSSHSLPDLAGGGGGGVGGGGGGVGGVGAEQEEARKLHGSTMNGDDKKKKNFGSIFKRRKKT